MNISLMEVLVGFILYVLILSGIVHFGYFRKIKDK